MDPERKQQWDSVHQPFELRYHKNDNYRWHDDLFVPAWESNFGRFLELKPDHFAPDDILIDIGAGSRPAFSYFTRGRCVHIEPLAEKYLEIPAVEPYWSPADLENLHPVAAETCLEEFIGRAAFVNCWNVLDHCFDWRAVVRNMVAYAKPGAVLSLCTDTKSHGDGHPGIDDVAELLTLLGRFSRFVKVEINYGVEVVRDIALKAVRI